MKKILASCKAEVKGLTTNSLFVAFVAISVLFLVLMNLFAGRALGHGDFMLTTAGVILIAPVMVLQNVITEIWGKKTALKVTGFAIFCQLVVVTLSQLVIALPTNNDNVDRAYNWANVFGSQWRIVSASIIAFVVGSILNILIFARLRKRSPQDKGNYRLLYIVAAIISTIIAQFVDSTIFFVLAFAPVGITVIEYSWRDIWTSIGTGTLVQIALELILVTVATVHIAKWLKGKKEKEEQEQLGIRSEELGMVDLVD
ncbi:MAG: queuosine precursor transporter [Firmicutes bacterium]|nr:queuosine precursor transporter [Bacillota bacterium]